MNLVLLVRLDAQIVGAEATLAQLLPDTPFAPLTAVPGWGTGVPPTTALLLVILTACLGEHG